MNKEVVSEKQGISLMILFIIGSSSIEVSGLEAEKDFWIAIIFAMFMVLPLVLVYVRIISIFPGKNLFDVIEICFGKFIGKVIVIIFTLFIFEEGAELFRNVGQFIAITSLTETNIAVIMLFLVTLSIWVVKEGIETLGRWGEFFVIIMICYVCISVLLLIPELSLDNVRPVLTNGMKPVLSGAYEVFIFPFAQTFTFTMVFSNFNKKKSTYRVFVLGLLIGGVMLFTISINGLLVLGIEEASNAYFASYEAIKRINVADVIQRVEIIIASIFVLGGFVKGSVFLIATCKGVAKIFKCNNYQFMIIPIALSMLNLAYFEFDNIMHFFRFSEVWYYYVFPFYVVLPIVIWLAAEIKKRQLN